MATRHDTAVLLHPSGADGPLGCRSVGIRDGAGVDSGTGDAKSMAYQLERLLHGIGTDRDGHGSIPSGGRVGYMFVERRGNAFRLSHFSRSVTGIGEGSVSLP